MTPCKFRFVFKLGNSMIPGSSMVEQEAVNFKVAGSSPAPGANKIVPQSEELFYCPRSNESSQSGGPDRLCSG